MCTLKSGGSTEGGAAAFFCRICLFVAEKCWSDKLVDIWEHG